MIAGIDGWSLMQVEHAVLKSRRPSRKNVYSNCFYICERCNKLRGIMPNRDSDGNRLLNPCKDVWAHHFERVGDEIRPRADDGSARYTWEVYELDADSKVTLRALRREWIEKYTTWLVRSEYFEQRLLDEMILNADDSKKAKLLKQLDLAKEFQDMRKPFLEALAQYSPIPGDADTSCLCKRTVHHTIPKVLADQTVDLEDLLRQAREFCNEADSGNVN